MSSYAGFLWVVIFVVLTKSYAGLLSSINKCNVALLHLLAKVICYCIHTEHTCSCFSHFLFHMMAVVQIIAMQAIPVSMIVTAAATNDARFVNLTTLSGIISKYNVKLRHCQ